MLSRFKFGKIPPSSQLLGNDETIGHLFINPDFMCAVRRRWWTAGESPARELGSLHPEAIGAAVKETKPSQPPV